MDISALSSFLCVSIGSDRADISHLILEFMRLLAKYDSNNNTGWLKKNHKRVACDDQRIPFFLTNRFLLHLSIFRFLS